MIHEYAHPGALVDTEWVDEHTRDPNVRLIEVDVNTTAYDDGHIRGAVGWHWQQHLQHETIRDVPDKDTWETLLGLAGVDNQTRVVLYGDNHNWFAAFAYWLFRLYGHEDVYLMNGGRQKWIDEGRLLVQGMPRRVHATYRAQDPDPAIRASRHEVEWALGQQSVAFVDVRSPQEFSGELLAPANLPQEGAQRGGHIPGAVNVPWAMAVADDGTFKPPAALTELYAGSGIHRDTPTISYCRIGERSAHTWFVLSELLGVASVRNYDGSWVEWGSLIGAPIER